MGESITVFRSRLRDDVPDRYFTLAAQLHDRARTFPVSSSSSSSSPTTVSASRW